MLSFQSTAEQIHLTRHKIHIHTHSHHHHHHHHTSIPTRPYRQAFLTSLAVPASLRQPTEQIPEENPEENAASNSKATGSGGGSGLVLFAAGVAVGALAAMLVKKGK